MYRIVKGQSMYPFLRVLDECGCRPIEFSDIKTGDIITFKAPKSAELGVHRVLSVEKGYVITKGDNVPFPLYETVPFKDIREKVIEVKRGTRTYRLDKFYREVLSKVIAFLSRYNLTPSLSKRRFIDPVLLGISKNRFYVFLRSSSYKDLFFSCVKKDSSRQVFAFTGKKESAKATLELKDDVIEVSLYVRHRDRNSLFTGKFLNKLIEVADKEFAPGYKLRINDFDITRFIDLKTNSLFSQRIIQSRLKDSAPRLDFFPAINFSVSELSEAEKLLISLSRLQVETRVQNSATFSNMDWDLFVEAASFNQLFPLVYKNFQVLSAAIPDKVLEVTRKEAARVFAYNTEMLEKVKLLNDLFSKENLEVLYTKGISFVADIYEDIALREFSDIDILVKEKDLEKIDRLLKREGFLVCGEDSSTETRVQRLYSLDNKFFLDVHTGFIGRKVHDELLNIDKEAIWRNKRKVNMNGVDLYTLDLVHTLLYQAIHIAMNHSFDGLKNYIDVHELILKYRGTIDWAEVFTKASEYKIKRPLYYTLVFTKNMLQTPVPDSFLEDLKKITRKSDAWVFNRIKKNNFGIDYLAEIWMFDSLRDAGKFIFTSFKRFPHLIGHFFKIFIRLSKHVLGKS